MDKRRSAGMGFVALTLTLLLVASLAFVGCGAQPAEPAASSENVAEPAKVAQVDYADPGDGYTLKQVIMLSRHNIRAPLSTNGSALASATTHKWIDWTANGSELTSRGGALETMNGQFVRKWLEHEGLVAENYRPKENEVRFYANAKQRTIATAQYFSSGMLPVANVPIETHAAYDEMDPVFNPQITYLTSAYQKAALEQVGELGGGEGMRGVAAGLVDSYALIQDVVDYTNSEGYKSGELKDLDTTDTEVTLEIGKEPAMGGSLKTACQLSDALVLQYYESSNKEAAFGKELTEEQWKLISSSKDTYNKVLFGVPLVSVNVAHPLLAEIGSELDTDGRAFTFLCGHDSNIMSVLSSLGVKEYELPGSIESGTPIGSKVTFEKWEGEDGKLYGRVRLLYQSTDQLRNGTMLAGYSAPMSAELSIEGLQKNSDGLYAYEDLRECINKAEKSYDELKKTYGEADALPNAA